jgi:hypothetical protein
MCGIPQAINNFLYGILAPIVLPSTRKSMNAGPVEGLRIGGADALASQFEFVIRQAQCDSVLILHDPLDCRWIDAMPRGNPALADYDPARRNGADFLVVGTSRDKNQES